MKLQWKSFIILLLASLIPMMLVTSFTQKASIELGAAISDQTQDALTETVRREIVSATENYAMITLGAKSSVEFALQLLAKEAAEVLNSPVSETEKLYFAHDFDQIESAPADLAPSEIHFKIGDDGKQTKRLVSFEQPSFLLAPGVVRDEVKDDIVRLSGLAPALRRIAGGLEQRGFWIYTSLESGVHISYPGHGGYPPGYDPRQRPWYIRAKNEQTLNWGTPIADPTTNQLTFSLSAPIYDADGTFAGVSAIDVLIPDVLLASEISSQWSNKMQSFLLGQSDKANGKQHHWVLSKTSKNRLDNTNNETGMFWVEDQQDFVILIDNIGSEKSGSLEMQYKGVDSFWSYAEVFPGLYFVIVAPTSILMELPEAVGKRFSEYTQTLKVVSALAVILVVFVIAGLAFLFSRSNTRNIIGIADGFKRLEQGDYSARLGIRFNDERDLIVDTFNRIVPKMEEHLRMSRALGIAKEVQQSLLPAENPMLSGYDIAGTSVYCEETGGDYYDFIRISDDRLAVVVGDVSGHGVSSALLMATARGLVMLRASMPGPAASIINDVNKHLSHDTSHTGNFMTFFYCELTTEKHEIRWVRAGHDPALIYDPTSDEFTELKGTGVAFGLDYTFEYEEFERTLSANQIILIGTDGIWEMRNNGDEMFGKERLKTIIRQNSTCTSKELLRIITTSLNEFRGNMILEDDVTMVVVKVV
ncbi:SpoIIE family protein phosphatase [Desulfosediminicola flagellatus]|uniref:SpoIIE family protein phosphatase n=1 Tax=Desulfosediminicola flagellatus TaxID=2569541 RepID=UPI0010AD8815|nr:SpoIIE family protein phosphatase [Desulfosediminicola flagellatus]